MVGNTGSAGSNGNQGFQGWQGLIGLTGLQGPAGGGSGTGSGAQGFQGPQGLSGSVGINFTSYGITGSQGPQGPASSGKEMSLYYMALNVPANAFATGSLLLPTSNTAFSIALANTQNMKMHKSGVITTGAIVSSAVVTAGTISMIPRVTGVNKPVLVSLNTTNNQSYTGAYVTTATFSANDTIGLVFQGIGLSPTTLDVTGWIQIEFN